MKGRVFIIAGSDSGGGAGIQADIKAVSALDGFAATAITALTAQNTQGVHGVHTVPVEFIEQQISVVLSDIGADCIKTGMLHDASVIETVATVLEREAANIPVVVDPVMVAKGGARLLVEDAVAAMVSRLLPLATVLTPNVPEAEALSGMTAASDADLATIADRLLEMGPAAVLLKGGHMDGDVIRDRLVTADGVDLFENVRIDTVHTHGTGCTLASATAAGIAAGLSLHDAVAQAEEYLHRAIEGAPGLGSGHGPVDHMHPVRR